MNKRALIVGIAAAPLILMITLVPVSIAGFGVRERGGTVLVPGAAGFTATEAKLLSRTGTVVPVISTLPGALAMLVPSLASGQADVTLQDR